MSVGKIEKRKNTDFYLGRSGQRLFFLIWPTPAKARQQRAQPMRAWGRAQQHSAGAAPASEHTGGAGRRHVVFDAWGMAGLTRLGLTAVYQSSRSCDGWGGAGRSRRLGGAHGVGPRLAQWVELALGRTGESSQERAPGEARRARAAAEFFLSLIRSCGEERGT